LRNPATLKQKEDDENSKNDAQRAFLFSFFAFISNNQRTPRVKSDQTGLKITGFCE
jgi:hypothetical protein